MSVPRVRILTQCGLDFLIRVIPGCWLSPSPDCLRAFEQRCRLAAFPAEPFFASVVRAKRAVGVTPLSRAIAYRYLPRCSLTRVPPRPPPGRVVCESSAPSESAHRFRVRVCSATAVTGSMRLVSQLLLGCSHESSESPPLGQASEVQSVVGLCFQEHRGRFGLLSL